MLEGMWKVLGLLHFCLRGTWLNGEQCRAIAAVATKGKKMMSELSYLLSVH